MQYEAIVVGVSAGGFNALTAVIPQLPKDFALPIIIVHHVAPHSGEYLIDHLNTLSRLTVKEAEDKEAIKPATVYIAPGGYHLLVEDDHRLSLNSDERVRYSRPSIDVLFESAADVYQNTLIGVVLTGANADGSEGLKLIKQEGGMAIVQDPSTAESATMPQEALQATQVDHIATLEEMPQLLCKVSAKRPVLWEKGHE